MSDAFPDVEGGVRTWLRLHPLIIARVSTRVFFGVPKPHAEANYPLITIQRVGGGTDASDVPMDFATIQFDVWGSFNTGGYGDKAGCRIVANALRAALSDLDLGSTLVASGVMVHGASVESDIWLPDPDDDRPRYVITAAIAAIAV